MISVNSKKINKIFQDITPTEEQKSRMLEKILSHQITYEAPIKRFRWWKHAIITISLASLLFLFLFIPPIAEKMSIYSNNFFGTEEITIKIADNKNVYEDFGTSVNYVHTRPTLEFFIEGDSIAKIEITSENEYLYGIDWTETQHRKYWDFDYHSTFDEERKTYVPNFDIIYDKQITMTFDEDFNEYDQIWYRWHSNSLLSWAVENDKFLGGHVQLDEYPEHLLKDIITITITNWKGKESTYYIHVKVTNNERRYTVVTAELSEKRMINW